MFDTTEIHEKLAYKVKHAGARRPFREAVSGDDLHRGSGTWSKIDRLIDREGDHYGNW